MQVFKPLEKLAGVLFDKVERDIAFVLDDERRKRAPGHELEEDLDLPLCIVVETAVVLHDVRVVELLDESNFHEQLAQLRWVRPSTQTHVFDLMVFCWLWEEKRKKERKEITFAESVYLRHHNHWPTVSTTP